MNGLMQQLRLADAENRSLQDKIDRKRHGIASLCFSLSVQNPARPSDAFLPAAFAACTS